MSSPFEQRLENELEQFIRDGVYKRLNYLESPQDARVRMEDRGQVVVRYCDGNPNGSARDIAGVRNAAGNVVGLMPHPEHNVDSLTGPTQEGRPIFNSILSFLSAKV